MVGAEHAQMGERVSVFWQPGGAGLFESGLADMTVSAFDHARADRQAQGQGTWIVQGIESIAQVAMALADRRRRAPERACSALEQTARDVAGAGGSVAFPGT